MSEWKEYRLGDILAIKSGFSYQSKFIGTGNSLLLGMGCVSYVERFIMSGARPYSGSYNERYKVYPGDIVLATRQQSDNLPILAMPAMVPESLKGKDIVIGTNLYKVDITDKSFSNEYIYWLMKTKRYVNYIRGVKTGTTVSMVTKKNVEDFTFFAPKDPKERESLVSVIKVLDSKIENNRKICANLEAQAQALFKHWFIDFAPFKDGKFVESELGMIPEGLIYKRIEDMPHTLETGKRPAGGVKGIDNGVPSIGAENIKGLGCYDYSKTKYVTKEYFDSMKKGKIHGYELLVYKDGGKPGYFIPNFAIFGEGYPYKEMCLNEHVFKLDFGNKGYSLFAYFFFKTKQIMSYLNAQGAKAAIPGINSKDIEVIRMPSLDNDCVQNYCNEVEDILTQILFLSKESSRLTSLRDTLLPKLMSGEIKV